jgi:hypothetical protein
MSDNQNKQRPQCDAELDREVLRERKFILADLLSAWLAPIPAALERRSAVRLLRLLAGALFARGRRTVTSWFRAASHGGARPQGKIRRARCNGPVVVFGRPRYATRADFGG